MCVVGPTVKAARVRRSNRTPACVCVSVQPNHTTTHSAHSSDVVVCIFMETENGIGVPHMVLAFRVCVYESVCVRVVR